ncbi:MAG: DUF2608 domain-containing protein, partial [Oligoflexia bacterium]|nr:DUF2608 domain-containing protein [Oligoflexia bacterium]
LVVDEYGQAQGIRQSNQVIQALQARGIPTLALTARYVVLEQQMANIAQLDHQISCQKKNIEEWNSLSDELIRKKLENDLADLQEKIEEELFRYHRFTLNNLRQVGIEKHPFFSSTEIFPNNWDDDFDIDLQNASSLMNLILHSEGIILASAQAKGVVLQNFLIIKGMEKKFKCIFYVDDQAGHVQNMNEVFAKAERPLELYSYHLPRP